MLKTLTLICLAVVLAGCTSLTPKGLRMAMRLNPLDTPPESLSVAVSVPGMVRLSDGDVVLALGFVPDPADAAKPVMARVPLSVASDVRAPDALSAEDRVYVLKLDAAAAQEMARVQSRIKSLKAVEIEGRGSLSITVDGGCLTAPLGDELPVATWVQPHSEAAFVLLTRRSDFFVALEAAQAKALRAKLRPC